MSLEFQYITLFSLYIPGCVLFRSLQGGGRGWWADKILAISHSLIIRLGEILDGRYLLFWMCDVSVLIGVFWSLSRPRRLVHRPRVWFSHSEGSLITNPELWHDTNKCSATFVSQQLGQPNDICCDVKDSGTMSSLPVRVIVQPRTEGQAIKDIVDIAKICTGSHKFW